MDKKRTYTKAQRQQLCDKYLSGKQNRKEFCEKHDVSTKSLSRWLLKKASQPQEVKFRSIGKLSASTNILTEINLPNGINLKLQLEIEKLHHLVKGLL